MRMSGVDIPNDTLFLIIQLLCVLDDHRSILRCKYVWVCLACLSSCVHDLGKSCSAGSFSLSFLLPQSSQNHHICFQTWSLQCSWICSEQVSVELDSHSCNWGPCGRPSLLVNLDDPLTGDFHSRTLATVEKCRHFGGRKEWTALDRMGWDGMGQVRLVSAQQLLPGSSFCLPASPLHAPTSKQTNFHKC